MSSVRQRHCTEMEENNEESLIKMSEHRGLIVSSGQTGKRKRMGDCQCPCRCKNPHSTVRQKWLDLDVDVYTRWCRFALELRLTPRQLAPVLLDVAMGLSPLPQRGRYVFRTARHGGGFRINIELHASQ